MSPKKRSIALPARGGGVAALLLAREEKVLSDVASEDDTELAADGLGDGIETRKGLLARDRFKAYFLARGGDGVGACRMFCMLFRLKRSSGSSSSSASK